MPNEKHKEGGYIPIEDAEGSSASVAKRFGVFTSVSKRMFSS
jgi:hypothetical protein